MHLMWHPPPSEVDIDAHFVALCLLAAAEVPFILPAFISMAAVVAALPFVYPPAFFMLMAILQCSSSGTC